MADVHGSPANGTQGAAAIGSGPVPAPYEGTLPAEPPRYREPSFDPVDIAGDIMHAGARVIETSDAYDVAAGPVDAPYYPGPLSPIDAGGSLDPGGRDDVAGDVGGAVGAATARLTALASDTYGPGSTIGDVMTLPPDPSDPGVGSLGTGYPAGSFYDPPRPGAPETYLVNTGNQPQNHP